MGHDASATDDALVAARARWHPRVVVLVPARPPAARLIGLVILATLVATVLGVGYAARAHSSEAARCQTYREDSLRRTAAVTGRGERVVVIGDSWSAGLHLARPAASWPARQPGTVHVYGFSGSGFAEGASDCGRVSFADRAPAAVRGGADLVLVEGGLNDVDQPSASIRAGFARLMRALAAYRTAGHLVVLGPAAAPARARGVPRVDTLLRALAAQYAVPYVATDGWDLPYLPDRLHLTAAGHREFGDLVATRLAGLGLAGLRSGS